MITMQNNLLFFGEGRVFPCDSRELFELGAKLSLLWTFCKDYDPADLQQELLTPVMEFLADSDNSTKDVTEACFYALAIAEVCHTLLPSSKSEPLRLFTRPLEVDCSCLEPRVMHPLPEYADSTHILKQVRDIFICRTDPGYDPHRIGLQAFAMSWLKAKEER